MSDVLWDTWLDVIGYSMLMGGREERSHSGDCERKGKRKLFKTDLRKIGSENVCGHSTHEIVTNG
jgi:hypothetical protein